ncbi:MAG: Na+/H+ antiporter subunit E [Rhodoplanes sp.]|uniref:Na+/H+ antiporter subunit E n=1 Tax=Rhodoplanes sp. TaxID=1968906 RepID=UPI00182CF908|nr:Na+/H+ antiporter subunit E [Rhodoplanes sp.]NVO14064.1 Na+/H+ antiporter subunit E [Rhodoplanes sp.]
MIGTVGEHRTVQRAAIVRAVLLFGFWTILAGVGVADLLVGVGVSALATRVSLHLLPATPRRYDPVAAARLALRFLRQSVVAGLDVARRAFDPRLPLRPGFVSYPARCPPGLFRSAFTAFTSLQPGTLPAGSDDGGIVYHCLDVDAPVVSQLATEEVALSGVVRHE